MKDERHQNQDEMHWKLLNVEKCAKTEFYLMANT